MCPAKTTGKRAIHSACYPTLTHACLLKICMGQMDVAITGLYFVDFFHNNDVSAQELAGRAIDADQLERQSLISIFSFKIVILLLDKPSVVTCHRPAGVRASDAVVNFRTPKTNLCLKCFWKKSTQKLHTHLSGHYCLSSCLHTPPRHSLRLMGARQDDAIGALRLKCYTPLYGARGHHLISPMSEGRTHRR
jgi:hypothetical protein